MTPETLQDPPPVPEWWAEGDWFDICSCNVPCPCTFDQPPTGNICDVVFAYRIRAGRFGGALLDGLKVVLVGGFTGYFWSSEDLTAGLFLDAAGDADQRHALQQIFLGQAGGWMARMVPAVRSFKGAEFADISIEINEALEHWRVEVPGTVTASGVALTGPTADPKRRVQTINPPGSEVGPIGDGAVTWGKSVDGRWQAFGFTQDIPAGQNSKHIPFAWSGPDPS